MLYEYPYTDLYNLNLDWMIKAMKEMQSIVEPLSIIVNTFNGRHGDVQLTLDDVNAVMVDVLWISSPGDTIDDLPQESLDSLYRIGRRIMIFINNANVPDTIYFLKWSSGHARPQQYSPTAALAGVASFNGQTGNVTATGSDLDTSDSDSTSIADTLSAQSQQIGNLGPVNNLTSDSTTAALSAAQGKALKVTRTIDNTAITLNVGTLSGNIGVLQNNVLQIRLFLNDLTLDSVTNIGAFNTITSLIPTYLSIFSYSRGRPINGGVYMAGKALTYYGEAITDPSSYVISGTIIVGGI